MLNAWLEAQCLKRQDDGVHGHSETIGERLPHDLDALMALPATPYDACEKVSTRATSISMVRYRNNDYSVPTAVAHHEVQVRGYVHKAVIALGPSGTGKTPVALGLGLVAPQKGMKVRFTTAAALGRERIEAADERRLQRHQQQIAAQDLLIIAELGFVPLSKTGAEWLFDVIAQRYERGSIIITSTLLFDEWTEVFGSERLTGAILDRLTHHVHILEMNGESYRLNQR